MEKINTSELVGQIWSQVDVNRKGVKDVIAEMSRQIVGLVKEGKSVTIAGLGTFKPVDKVARTCRNPATGGSVDVPAKRVLAFKAAAGNKDI